MSKQIVVSGNRVLAHGENCFTAYGGKVICMEKDRAYENATVVNVETVPADIDEVGYEYHAGVFVPCAPYGKGMGNLAVVCNNDCKSIKDGGLPLSAFFNGGLPVPARIVHGTYTGSLKYGQNNPNTLSFDFAPLLVCVFSNDAYPRTNSKAESLERQLIMCRGVTEQPCIRQSGTEYFVTDGARKIIWGENSVTWYTTTESSYDQWNGYQHTYHYIAIG